MFDSISKTEILMIAGPAIMFLVVLEMVRRRRLREDYSLIWLGTFGVMVLLSLFRNTVLYVIANMMGIFYPPAALFVIGFTLLFVVLLQFSTVISKLALQNKRSAQHIALLTARVTELEKKLSENVS